MLTVMGSSMFGDAPEFSEQEETENRDKEAARKIASPRGETLR
jgi:hypothetical protein